MEIQTTKFREWDYCYHEQHKGKKRELLMVLKDYKQWNKDESRSTYCSFEKEYVRFYKKRKNCGRKRNQNRWIID